GLIYSGYEKTTDNSAWPYMFRLPEADDADLADGNKLANLTQSRRECLLCGSALNIPVILYNNLV
ncbi:MAG: hypothetical protein JXB88_24305, partial [Spirochaetales bacterium]|nr:hypothetical protein [Spirochaetales bacterium]